MEAKKISQLAEASALSGAERLPIVQSGQTVGATVAQVRDGLLPSGHAGSGGDAHATAVAAGLAGFLSGADKSKLDGIQAGATANATDANLLNRNNHIGSQEIGTVTGLQSALDAKAPVNTPTFTGTVFASALSISSSVNAGTSNTDYITLTGGGGTVRLDAVGGDPTINLSLATKGGGGAYFWRNGYGSALSLLIDGSGHMLPGSDNSQNMGAADKRYAQVYAGTGTINTSDEREKEAIAPVDPALARALVRAFDPVTFKWRDIDRAEVVERRMVTRQRTEPVTVIEDVVERSGDIFVRRKVERIIEQPLFIEHSVHDETGAPLLDADGRPVPHLEPVMEEVEDEAVISPAYRKVNHRTHWGFVAQQVERGLCETLGLGREEARKRFAGLVHDEAADRYGLREGQFIPILWATLRGLLDRVEALEAARPSA